MLEKYWTYIRTYTINIVSPCAISHGLSHLNEAIVEQVQVLG